MKIVLVFSSAIAAFVSVPALLSAQPPPAPEGPLVVLFDRPNFRGEAIEIGPGEEIENLSHITFSNGQRANDAVSSILVERGAAVVVSLDSRFRGETIRFTESVENLADIERAAGGSWNDAISSARAEALPPGRHGRRRGADREPRVIVYRDRNFGGEFFEIFPGETFDNLARAEFDGWLEANDEISSIRVVGPVRARVGTDRGFRGEVMEVTDDMADLTQERRRNGSSTWNDAISSIEVERTSIVDDPGLGGGGNRRPPAIDPEVLVRGVFAELLVREPTSTELRSYRRRITEDRWGEEEVRADIRRSSEFRQREADVIVTRAYREILGRDPEPDGLANYRRAILEQGWNEKKLREALMRSPEYRARITPATPGLSPGVYAGPPPTAAVPGAPPVQPEPPPDTGAAEAKP